MADTDGGNKPDAQIEKPRTPRVRSIWGISYIKRKFRERKAEKKDENPADKAARRTANATVWIAAFTIVLAVVGAITLYEVIAGGADTHDLAIAAKKQADASHLDQRAWVGAGDGKFVINVKTLRVEATIKNVGKTPAIEATSNIAWIGKLKDQRFTLSDIKYPNPEMSHGTIFPTQSLQISNSLPEPVPPFHAVFVEAMKKSEYLLYVFGQIRYRDIFKVTHWTHFCMVVHPDLVTNSACDIYGDSDPDPTENQKPN